MPSYIFQNVEEIIFNAFTIKINEETDVITLI